MAPGHASNDQKREIERKFLVRGDAWRAGATSTSLRQGYLSTHPDRTVRVRIEAGRATLTIKGRTVGIGRDELEYPIPTDDATHLLDHLCERPLIEKTRHVVEVEGHRFEVDEFAGDNRGLVVAELELPSEDASFPRPSWLGEEVSGDPRYFNSNLLKRPFSTW